VSNGQLLQEIRDSGVKLDADSRRNAFLEATHPEGADKLLLASSLIEAFGTTTSEVPLVGAPELDRDLTPLAQWPQYSAVLDFIELSTPAMQQLRKALDCPKPIRLPMAFDEPQPFGAAYYALRDFENVLPLHLEIALRSGDAEAAIELVRLSSQLQAAIPKILTLDSLRSVLLRSTRDLIKRCLAADIWTEEQVAELSKLVGEPLDASYFQQSQLEIIASLVHQARENGTIPYTSRQPVLLRWPARLPSLHNAALRKSIELAQRDASDLVSLSRPTPGLYRPSHVDSAGEVLHGTMQEFDPAYNFAWATLAWSENSRRFTTAALAVKQYKMANDRWPSQLADIATPSDAPAETVHGHTFGYFAEDDVAYLWSYSSPTQLQAPIPAQLPTHAKSEKLTRDDYVITIR
jgi:hypothetical protein